jgi:hypothetical protein
LSPPAFGGEFERRQNEAVLIALNMSASAQDQHRVLPPLVTFRIDRLSWPKQNADTTRVSKAEAVCSPVKGTSIQKIEIKDLSVSSDSIAFRRFR